MQELLVTQQRHRYRNKRYRVISDAGAKSKSGYNK
jgi:hypothetical protein